MIRAVLDTRVLVAAVLTPGWVCGQILRAVVDERCTIAVCPLLLAELEDVLLRPDSEAGFLNRQHAVTSSSWSGLQSVIPTR